MQQRFHLQPLRHALSGGGDSYEKKGNPLHANWAPIMFQDEIEMNNKNKRRTKNAK